MKIKTVFFTFPNFDTAQSWANQNVEGDYFIHSFMSGTKTDAYQERIEIYTYEVCVLRDID